MATTVPRTTRRMRKPMNRPRGSASEYSHIDLRGGVAENINFVAASISAGDTEVNAVRKVAYLNAFVRLLQRNRESFAEHQLFTRLLYSLRACLLNEQRSVRAATLRTLRYLVNDGEMVQRLVDIKLDLLIMRSFDSVDARPVERVQAMRFIRKLVVVCPQHIPHSLVVALVATAEHSNAEEKLMNAALATLSEIAVVNPSIVAFSRGIKVILRGAVDCVSSRMGESLLMSILYLLNHPDTRCFIRPHIELEVIVAPFTDTHYRHSAEAQKDEPKEDRVLQIRAARISAATMFRSWAGLICFCDPNGWGMKSLVGVLRLPNSTTRRGVMDLLYDIFKLNSPEWTDDFEQALASTDPCRPRDSWRLEEQWVVEEAKVVLSHLRKERTNLVTCYIAMLLTTFIQAGLFESLVEVVRSGNDSIVVQATILLGELLHLANTILPLECSSQTHCLPSLISVATSFDTTATERNRATAVVNCLDRLHQRKKISTRPDSLYLQLTLSKSESTELKDSTVGREPQITNSVLKELEDANIDGMLRESQVVSTKDVNQWNWNLIGSVLKSPHVTMKRLEEGSATKFVKRLCYFYKPSSGLFCKVEQTYANVQKYSAAGSRLMQFLLGGEEGIKFAHELVAEITACIKKVADGSASRDDILSTGSVSHTLSRDYFLFLGQLTTSSTGMEILRKLSTFSCLLGVCDVIQRRDLNKLLLTSLDYSHSRLCRVILSKILTGIDSTMRLYATSYLRVILRAHLPEFKDWGIEMIITQLYDTEDNVVNEAVDILDEACDDESYLHTVVLRFPALLHIRDKGAALFTRFLSVNRGFWYLQSLNYVTEEMDRWYQDYNRQYVVQTEQCLAECLTGYRKTDEGVYIRRSQIQLARLDVFAPVHFYGQLVQLKEGCQLLQRQKHLDMFIETLKNPSMTTSDVLDKKAVIWALGHIGTSHWGEQLLEGKGVINQLVQVAETSPVLSIRGTAFYALCLIARTKQGSDRLNQLGWLCLRHRGEQLWPVTEDSRRSTVDPDICSPERQMSSSSSTAFTPVFSELDNPISSYQPSSPDKPNYRHKQHRHSLVITRSTTNDFQTLLPLQKSESLGTILDSSGSSFRIKESNSDEHLNINKPLSLVVPKHNRSSSSDGNFDKEKRSTLDSPRALRHILEGLDSMNSAARLIGRRSARPISLLVDAEAVRKLYVAESPVSEFRSSWSDDSRSRTTSGIPGEGSYVGVTVPANLDAFYKVEHSEYKGSWATVFPSDINEKFMDLLEKKGAATKIPAPNEEQDSDEQQEEKQQERTVDPAVLRKELFRLLGNLATAVGSKATQQGLLLLKDSFPNIFTDSVVYLDVCEMLAVYHYSLPARRLAHSLFEGIKLDPAPPKIIPSKGRNRSFSTSETNDADLAAAASQLGELKGEAFRRRRSSCGDIDQFRNELAAKEAVKPRPINVSHTGTQSNSEQLRANCEQGRRDRRYFALEDI